MAAQSRKDSIARNISKSTKTMHATPTPSRRTEQLAARNGPRHSVYWVQQKKSAGSRLPTHANVLDATSMGDSSGGRVEYTLLGKYTGEWKDGVKHGYGVLVYANGNKYEGDWCDGVREGKGVYWVQASKSKASQKKPTLRKQYAGEWHRDKRHGLGTFFHEDGSRFEGFWVQNNREGDGRMVYGRDKSVYEGQWSANVRSGHGTLTLANGDVYDGSWLHDKKEGPGRFYYKASGKVYDGEWVDDAPQCGTYSDIVPAAGGSGAQAVSQFGHDGTNPLSRLHRFELPELELAQPEHVVSASVARIRQDRVLALRAVAAANHDDHSRCDHDDSEEDGTDQADGSPATGPHETSVVFDDRTMRVLETQFTTLVQVHASERSSRQTHGCVPCSALLALVGAVGLRIDAPQLSAFLDEVGATSETLVSFAECVDILSLLAESAMGSGSGDALGDDESEGEGDDEEEDEGT